MTPSFCCRCCFVYTYTCICTQTQLLVRCVSVLAFVSFPSSMCSFVLLCRRSRHKWNEQNKRNKNKTDKSSNNEMRPDVVGVEETNARSPTHAPLLYPTVRCLTTTYYLLGCWYFVVLYGWERAKNTFWDFSKQTCKNSKTQQKN